MLVLPSTRAPRRVEPAHRGRGVGRPVALEDPRAGRRRRALGAEDVLDRDRDAAQRPVLDLVPVPSSTAQRYAFSSSPAAASRQASWYSSGETRPAAISADRLGDGEAEQLGAHSACGEGARKAPSAGSGAGSSIASRGQLGRGSSGRRTFSSSTTCEVGSTPSRSSCRDPVDVVEDPGELAGHALDLLVAEPQPRQLRHVQDLCPVDHARESKAR